MDAYNGRILRGIALVKLALSTAMYLTGDIVGIYFHLVKDNGAAVPASATDEYPFTFPWASRGLRFQHKASANSQGTHGISNPKGNCGQYSERKLPRTLH